MQNFSFYTLFHLYNRLASKLLPNTKASYNPIWFYLWPILLVAFFIRIIVALSGDFVIHPDEIMQYLEPAHRLVFESAIIPWEYIYGARSWIVPGIIAGILKLCQILGLDSPTYYIAFVKVFFCGISLFIPYGIYYAGRHFFNETTARIALVLVSFWYELVGFAHKPMTEFIATSLLFLLIAIVIRLPRNLSLKQAILAAAIAMFLIAIRFQYTLVTGLVLLYGFIRSYNRVRLAICITSFIVLLAIGFFEYLSWGTFMHSYIVNWRINSFWSSQFLGEPPWWIYLKWLLIASAGIAPIVIAFSFYLKKQRFWLLLLLAVLIPHFFFGHLEYRFIFATIPIWLLLFANLLAIGIKKWNSEKLKQKFILVGIGYAGLISLWGILNAIPFQKEVYQTTAPYPASVRFLRKQDGLLQTYRHLATDRSVKGVLHANLGYFYTGGYYYLHHKIPFYDISLLQNKFSLEEAHHYVSHIIIEKAVEPDSFIKNAKNSSISYIKTKDGKYIRLPYLLNYRALKKLVYYTGNSAPIVLSNYALYKNFANFSIYKRVNNSSPIRKWKNYEVKAVWPALYESIKKALRNPNIPKPIENYGIRILNE